MPKRYSLGLVVAAVMTLAGCGIFPIGSNNSSGTNSVSQLKAASAVLFGTVPVGGTRSGSVAVSNTATDGTKITVSHIDVSGAGFQIGSSPSLPFVIEAGKSVTLGINFSPMSKGTVNGKVSIMSDATDPVLPVALSGSGNASGQITVSPAVMNFGSVGVGGTAGINGTISAANSSMTVSTVDQTGQGYTLSGINFPVTLAAGQSVPFTVTFTPQAPGTSVGSLAFVTSGSNSATASLTGSGVQSGTHSVALSWSASTSPVAGYNVYRSLQSGGPYAKLTGSPLPSTSYADSNVQSGSTYYYVATSVTSNADESGYSNQTAATIP
jgi:Abnormal spindle-like microcephaly-assoc'd, ASPM-SPD-2-Hydin